ncbi:MAG: ATP-binding cassette domain-containing protein [Cyanobacteria bacterium P01_G01_bin.38]
MEKIAGETAQIKFDRVSVQAPVGLNEILRDLSFDIKTGSFVGVVGASGAGKTTLLRLMNRLVEPSQGQILWQGQSLATLPVVPLRRQMSLVLQDSKLLGMSVEAALCYPAVLRGQAPAQAKQQMLPWLDRLKIPRDWLSRTEAELSMGQRQRVAIARALIAAPQLLLLDEPTSAQDIGFAEFLLTQLQQLTQQQQLTIVMANHQLELIAPVVTQVLHLQAGQLQSNQSKDRVDWSALRTAIVEAHQTADSEWGDD